MTEQETTLDDLITLAGQHARVVLIGLGQDLVPTWVLVTARDGIKIVATPWKDEQETARYRQGMRGLCKAAGVVAYSFLTEAWAAHLEPEEWNNSLGYVRPSQRIDRREMVIACAATATESKFAQWGIERDSDGKVTDLKPEPMPKGQGESWLAEILK